MADTLYKVHMWLTFDYTDPACDSACKIRFPNARRDAWWLFEITASDEADFKTQLHDLIMTDCLKEIADDLANGVPGDILGVSAFGSSPWMSGGGGQHEGTGPVMVDIKNVNSPTAWKFMCGSVTISITARFYRSVK